jgi:hypothetical protein
LLLVILGSCKDKPVDQPKRAPDDDVKPAFEGTPRSVPPPVAALCRALHQLPVERKAACCHTSAGAHFASECARVLSLALEAGTVQLQGVEACVKSLEAQHDGCGWVGPNEAPLPATCSALITGNLAPGAKCRSSLECKQGTRCAGAGATATGVCAPPGREGLACELSVDVLASYTRQRLPAHLECAGFCQRHRCEPVLLDGGVCTLDAQCPTGQRCGGTCVEGTAGAEGEKCVPGGCAEPLRCVAGTCARLKAEGEPCASDLECLGACVGGADAGRTCGMGC